MRIDGIYQHLHIAFGGVNVSLRKAENENDEQLALMPR